MRYVFVSYNYSHNFHSPGSWLKRTDLYTGMQEQLAIDNEVINIKQIDYQGNYIHNGVDHRFVRFYKKRTFFPLRLNRYIARQEPDIMVIQGLHHPVQVILLSWVLPRKTKLMLQHHAEMPFSGWKRSIQKLADKFVDAYLFTSKQISEDWVKKSIISSNKKIYEVMEVSSRFYPFEKKIACTKTGVCGNPVFLWVGRLNANKDPLTVVNAFLRFTDAEPGARLYMFFHTEELRSEIERLILINNACDKIILKGHVEKEELLDWYNSADFFLSGSHYEGSGTALCEAMSCGCVPIVTDIPSFRMITGNGDCGCLYPPGDEQALLEALLQTKSLDLPQHRTRALNYFNSNLSFPAIAQQIQAVTNSL